MSRNKTVVVMDIDSALTIAPVFSMVASAADLMEEVGVLTRATHNGELPFARSVKLRTRLLAEVAVSEAQRRVAVTPLDPDVLACVRALGERIYLMSEAPGCWLTEFQERLGIPIAASKALVENDRLTGLVSVLDKAEVIGELRAEYDRIVAIGSDLGDVALLEHADVGVAIGLSVPSEVRTLCRYWVTGGRGLCQLSNEW